MPDQAPPIVTTLDVLLLTEQHNPRELTASPLYRPFKDILTRDNNHHDLVRLDGSDLLD